MVCTAGLKRLQKKIFLPVNLSVLASVGIHGVLLGVVLPKWDVDVQPAQDSTLSNIPVIELNQFERTRLPDLLWSKGNLMPQLPPPKIQIPAPSTSQPDSSTFSALPLPPPILTPSTLPPLPSSEIDSSSIATLAPEIENLDIKTRQSLFRAPENDRQSDPRELINRKTPPNQPPNQETPIAANPSNSTINQRDSNGDRVALDSPPARPLSYSRLSAMLQVDASNTTNEEARKNYVAWLKDIGEVAPQQFTLAGVYPKAACIRKLEGTAAYGVTVNLQGKVTDSRLIKSAGYPLFNQEALTQIQEKSFANPNGSSKAYHVYVKFIYNPDICPSLALERVNAPLAKPESNPNLQSSSDSTSKPAATNSSPKSLVETEEVNPSLSLPNSDTQPENTQPAKSESEMSSQGANQPVQITPINTKPESAKTEGQKNPE